MRPAPLRFACLFSGILSLSAYLAGCALLVRFPSEGSTAKSGERQVYRGVFHLHTKFSHDSKISLKAVRQEAQKGGLDFAVITDHNTLEGKEAYRRGAFPAAPLLIFGTEISTADGHLIALGIDEMPPTGKSTEDLISWIRSRGGCSILAHPESSKNPWDRPELEGMSGLEVFNFAHSFYDVNKFRLAGQVFLFPKAFLKSFQKRAPLYLELWDKKLAEGRYAAFGAADAHIHWKFLGLSVESYFLQLRAVTMYAFTDELKEEKIIEALGTGKSFIAFEAWGNAAGFSFSASENLTVPGTAVTGSMNLSRNVPGTGRYGPGDIFTPSGSFLLSVRTPAEARLRLIHRGQLLKEVKGRTLDYSGSEPGPYRVEAYKGKNLWIISNPIYVER